MVVYAIIVLVGYNLLKYFVLSKIKVKINKWIIFAIAMVALLLPNILVAAFHVNIQNNALWVYGPSSLFIILFLWFIDLSGWNRRAGKASNSGTGYYDKKSKKDKIVIKPKAKPNRVKNRKD
ncbi:hypothetical protein HMPREF1982_00058 [Clostridiales bacterium oral taxon 876 str. F0540]|nr:hypothetical protein HMPREF1982_00058 [Clostridiales bacterium oral taxon 876 str. F0540]